MNPGKNILKKIASRLRRTDIVRQESGHGPRGGEDYLRILAEASFEGIAVTENEKIVETNAAFDEMFGYEPSEAIGMDALDFVAPEFRELARQNRSSNHGEPYEVNMLRKDGTTFPAEARGKTVLYRGRQARVSAIRDITGHRQYEESLRESERRFRHLFDQSVDALIVHDESGRIVDCNLETCRSLGYSREELLNLRVQDFATNLLGEKEKASRERATPWQKAMTEEAGRISGVHLGEHRRKDGTRFPVEVRISPIDYGDRRLIFASARDITERRKAEEELREAETRYRTLVESMPAITYTERVDETSSAIYVSPQLERMLGYTPDEWISTPDLWIKILYPDDRERVLAEHYRTNETGEPFEMEYRLIAKDGRVVWVRDEAVLVRDENDEPLYWQGVKLDITRRKNAEEEMRKSEEKYRSILEQIQDGYFEVNLAGDFTFFNDRLCEILGYPADELLGMNNREYMDQENAKKVYETFNEVYRTGRSIESFDWEIIRKDGDRRFVEASITLIRDESGNPAGFRGIVRDVTERYRAEEELREAHQKLSFHVDNSPLGVLEWDKNLRILHWSKEMERLFGWRAEEVTGKRIDTDFRFLYEEDKEAISKVMASLLDGSERRVVFQNRNYAKDGSVVICEWYNSALVDDSGELISVMSLAMDLTERERNKEELARLASFPEQNPNPVLEVDRTGNISYLNPAARETFPDISARGLRHPILKDVSALADELRASGQRSLEREIEIGDRVYEQKISIAPTSDTRIYLSDITERERAEAELRQAENRYRTLVERMPAVTYVQEIGSPDSAMYMSPQIESLTGYTPEDCKDPDLRWRMVHPDDRERLQAEDDQPVEPGRVSTTEYRVLHRDGRVVWVRNESVVVEDEASGARYWQGFMVDITERKRAEEELMRAKEAAEDASQAKSEFLANMSHEIRTPMNGVIGMTELLLDTALTPEQREYAETVSNSGEALLRIINDILDFSKIEAGKMQLEILDFDLHEAVEEVAGLFANLAHRKGLELACFIEPDVPGRLRGDPFRLRQILTNLASNAIKFTERGEVVIRARLLKESKNVATVRFEVSDTGIGISPEEKSRLFKAFSQADTSTTRRYGGTGLGLTICRRLVRLMGGEIGVETEPGEGSTFWFSVPLEEPISAAEKRLEPRNLRGLRVLIVDDNKTNRSILCEQASSWGMRNASAEDGPQALKMLREAAEEGEPYELAILDMHMPLMDGMSLAREIKSDPSISETRLLLLTSLLGHGMREEATRAGILVYLNKPVRQSELYNGLVTAMQIPKVEPVSPPEPEAEPVSPLFSTDEEKKPQILVAEDNPVNQRVAARMLEKLGYRVEVAENGLEAIRKLSQAPYDAVLMDCQMPEMDGYETTAEIRRREQSEEASIHTPIIAMTANALAGDREKALEAGMDDYLSKPVRPEELERILERWIQRPDAEDLLEDLDGEAARITAEGSLDLGVLASLRELQEEGEPDILAELVEMFLEDAPRRLASLREAIQRGDAGEVERTAHTLKGSCGNMGARRMHELAADLQAIGASGDLSGAAERLDLLEEEFGRVRLALIEVSES